MAIFTSTMAFFKKKLASNNKMWCW